MWKLCNFDWTAPYVAIVRRKTIWNWKKNWSIFWTYRKCFKRTNRIEKASAFSFILFYEFQRLWQEISSNTMILWTEWVILRRLMARKTSVKIITSGFIHRIHTYIKVLSHWCIARKIQSETGLKKNKLNNKHRNEFKRIKTIRARNYMR